MRVLILLLIGILVGGGSVGSAWWWSLQRLSPKSPYWDVKATDPTFWQHDERDKTGWKAGDMTDCHGLVAWMHSQQYMKWERRVDRFTSCMRSKGYTLTVQQEPLNKTEETPASPQ